MDYREKIVHGEEGLPVAIYELQPGSSRYVMNMHWHPDHEILHVRRGRMTLRLDDEELELCEGDVIFISGGVIHSAQPRECSYTCILVNLPLMMKRSDSCMALVERIERGEVRIKHRLPCDELADICSQILELHRNRSEGYPFMMKGLVFSLFGKIFEKRLYIENATQKVSDSSLNLKMKSVIEYIEKNYSEKITLEDLSRITGMTKNHFCRVFRALSGVTPFEYITRHRLMRARHMLKTADFPITDVALECGFSDSSYFIKVFGREYGITPAKFRKSAE